MRTARILLVGFAGLYYYAAASLYLMPDTLYIGHDGECIIESIKLLFDYAATPLDLSVFSPLEGLGTVVQPVGVWLHPGCWPFALFDDDLTAKMVSCLIVVVCVSTTTYWLARAFDLPPLPSLLTAQGTGLLFFPPIAAIFFQHLSLSHLYALWPFLGFTTSLASLFLLALMGISGETARGRLIARMLALPVLVLLAVLTDPLHTPVLFVPAGVVSVAAVLASRQRVTFRRRTAALTVCLLVLLACDLPHYYQALSGYAARQEFPHEIGGEIQRFDRFVSFVLQGPLAGALVGLLVSSCAAVLWLGSRQQRGLSAAVLAVQGLVLAASLYYVYGGVAWNRPPPAYFEHGAVALYLLAFSLGVWLAARRVGATGWGARLSTWWERKLGSHRPLWGYLVALALPGTAGLFIVAANSSADSVGMPPPPGPILQRLIDELALEPRQPFAGSVATLVAVPGGPVARQYEVPDSAPFSEELINLRTDYLRVAPHGLYQAALWRRKIPTLEQYNTLATTPMYFLFSRALARQHDYQMKNFVLVTRARPALLACLGCRFVITDQQLQDPRFRLRVAETNAFGIVFRLYELDRPNLGQYSPVNVRRVDDASKAVALMRQDFDFLRDVVLFQEEEVPSLVPARAAPLSFVRGGVRVQASSSGNSLLVLPLQYSHTLQVAGGAADRVQLLRANITQTAVLFSGSINILIADTFGLLRTAARLQDIQECRDLGMVETGEVNYPDYFLPYSSRE